HLNKLFGTLSGDTRLAAHQNSLKKLKKLIHLFAQENEFECRLFNLEELTNRLEKEEENATSEYEKCKIKEKLNYIENTLRFGYPKRKYAYISDARFHPFSTEKERKVRRR